MSKYEYRSATDLAVAENDDKKMVLTGKAIAFGSKAPVPNSKLGTKYEVITPDALENAKMDDVLLKIQHEQRGVTLARTRNGSLQLETRADGLYFTAVLPNTSAGRDTYESVKSGLLTDMSFGFLPASQQIDKANSTRIIDGIRYVRELSLVDTGAYSDCYVEARAKQEAEEAEAEAQEAEKAAELEKRRKILRLRTFFI